MPWTDPRDEEIAKLSAEVESAKLSMEMAVRGQQAEARMHRTAMDKVAVMELQLAEAEKLKQGYYNEAAEGWKKFRDAERLNGELLNLLKRAADALGPDRTSTDRREICLLLGPYIVENRQYEPPKCSCDKVIMMGGYCQLHG